MRILIVAEYLDDISKPNTYNSRFLTIADALSAHGHNVQIVTTDFIHRAKKHISENSISMPYEVIILHEPGYKKNVCLTRFYSHHILAKNLNKWLERIELPDVIYCAVPSLEFALVAARYAKQKHIRFIVDIQDLWPEAFEMIFKVPVVSRLIFTPFRRQANEIYRSADCIVAVSQTYLDRALQVNLDNKNHQVVFLGTDLNQFDSYTDEPFPIEKQKGEIWLAYVGTLGHSYDLMTVFKALEILKMQPGYEALRFIVMGDGPMRSNFEQYVTEKELNVCFTGNLPYPNMVAGLKKCDIVVNPIRKGAAQSVINKHGDYAAAGIPVINTQENEEYRQLISEYKCGINCSCSNEAEVAQAILTIIRSDDKRIHMGEQSRRMAEDLFDRKHTYKKIYKIIVEE